MVYCRRPHPGEDAGRNRLRRRDAARFADRLRHGHPQPWNLRLIIDNAKVPIIVDAGVGTASDAAIAMELGCDGVLMNTAIAHAKDPVLMASAMKRASRPGARPSLAGRMPRKCSTPPILVPDQRPHRFMSEGAYTAGRAGEPHGHIKSFVRRAGRMSEAQERYYAEMMPRIGVPYAAAPSTSTPPSAAAPENPRDRLRHGETTARSPKPARQRLPRRRGAPRRRRLCKLIATRELANLRICQHDAVEGAPHAGVDSLDGIHIFSPTPGTKAPQSAASSSRPSSPCWRPASNPAATALRHRLGGIRRPDAGSPFRRAGLQNTADGFAPRPDYRPSPGSRTAASAWATGCGT